MGTVNLEVAVPGRKQAGTPPHDIELGIAEGPVTLEQMIAAVVRAEVAAFTERQAADRYVRILSAEAIDEGLAAGAVRSGPRGDRTGADVDDRGDVDVEDSVSVALLAHKDGFFQVIVDGDPVDDPATLIDLHDGTTVMFVRLVPLAGG